jgi:ubiquinone/menaquinone biosynthesis C-methylase UbiE
MTDNRSYPALLVDWLTPAYDFFVRLVLREMRIKRDLIAHARVAPGDHVLDLGAGTGTLAILIKQMHPGAQVTAVDADPKVLALAMRKAAHAEADIAFTRGNVAALPYDDESFDRVVSSLVFSLLSSEDKHRAVREAYRVLRGGGELHIADFGPPHTLWGRLVAPRIRRFEPISDNLDGRLPAMFREEGFEDVNEAAHFATIFGTISLLHGRRPA